VELSEADALLLDRSPRFSPRESALEQGWLLAEVEQRFHYTLAELARRFDRSVSWVTRRLALTELLPDEVQQQVRAGALSAQLAVKYLAPVARVSAADCTRLAAIFAAQPCDARQAGQLYSAWRDSPPVARERLLAEPQLFLKTQRQKGPAKPAALTFGRELEMATALLRRAAQRLTAALAEMNAEQQKQAQERIRCACDELTRMAERIGKEPPPAPAGQYQC
jgi:hypothetical protein